MRQRARFNSGAASTSSWLNQVKHFFALLTDKKSGAATIEASTLYAQTSIPSSATTAPTLNPSNGQSPLMTSSLPSNASADSTLAQNTIQCCELLVRDTRSLWDLGGLGSFSNNCEDLLKNLKG
jgi:hypothetical protein